MFVCFTFVSSVINLIYLKQPVLSYQFVNAALIKTKFVTVYLLSYLAIFLGTSGAWVQTQSIYAMSVG